MELRQSEDSAFTVIKPVLEGMGYSIVDCVSHGIRTGVHVSCIIYRESGVSADDCADVYRLICPRLEVAFENRDIHLEVSSPGIDRQLKYADEFRIFTGRPVRIMVGEGSDWVSGIIRNAGSEGLDLDKAGSLSAIRYEQIRKAKLE